MTSPISDKVVEAAKNWLRKSNKDFRSIANFAYFTREADLAIEYFGRGCHAMFEVFKEKACVIATEVVCTNRKNVNGQELNKESLAFFLDWFVNESIYSCCILTKDVEEIIEDTNGIVISLDFPSPIVMSALIISRHANEKNQEIFKVFKEMVEKGYDPNVSFYIAINCNFGLKALSNMETSAFNWTSAHFALGSISMAELENMKNKQLGPFVEMNKKAEDPDNRTIYGTTTIYSPLPSERRDFFTTELIKDSEDLRNRLRVFRSGGSGEVYKPPNPFSNSGSIMLRPDQVTIKEMEEIVLPYIQEKGYI